MSQFKAIDLFCGAGGATRGLQMAGFHVTGVDNRPQKHYCGDAFILGDALQADLAGYNLAWTSPPCQAFSVMRHLPNARHDHPDLIEATRHKLVKSGLPFIIENVPGAPIRCDVLLCGTMFGLRTHDHTGELRRHRHFELNWSPPLTYPCQHNQAVNGAIGVCGGGFTSDTSDTRTISMVGNSPMAYRGSVNVYGHGGGSSLREKRRMFTTEQGREAMGIDWMTGAELSQAVPPAYAEFLGRQILKILRAEK
jgi:DNA (cytosine-5)-methyltransferase 1